MLVMGLDEVGRGPLAGPVLSACVVIDSDVLSSIGVNDSKVLTESKRRFLYSKITQASLCWSVGLASVAEIDELNIRQATLLSMRRAAALCPHQPSVAWVDGRDDPGLNVPVNTVIGGDQSIPVIAAASIIAKVFRDDIMIALDIQYPGYGLAQHKGYGTKVHQDAMLRMGISLMHRRSFKPVKNLVSRTLGCTEIT